MNKHGFRLGVTLSLLFLASCAHMTKEECLTTNWGALGLRDGILGNPPNQIFDHQQACAQYGIAVDNKGYLAGWRHGIRQYCQPAQGYALGTAGKNMVGYCPVDLAPRFARAWQKGLRAYCIPQIAFALGKSGQEAPNYCPPDLQPLFFTEYQRGRGVNQHLTELNSRISQLNAQLANINQQIDAVNRRLIAPPAPLSPEERMRLENERTLLLMSKNQLQLQIQQAQDQSAQFNVMN